MSVHLSWHIRFACIWQVLINVVCFPQTTPPVVPRAHKKSFPGGAPPPDLPIGRPLSQPPKARRAPQSSLWPAAVAACEGQCLGSCPRSACLVRMIWVKDQHAQHWPWTLSRWTQGGLFSTNSPGAKTQTAFDHRALCISKNLWWKTWVNTTRT